MENQAEVWVIMQDAECDKVWDRVDSEFNFNPSMVNNLPPFTFSIPVNVYDISHSNLYKDDEKLIDIMKTIFVDCMGNDDFMYALDWQHTCFRYNPRIADNFEYPVFVKYDVPIKNEHVNWEGYNVYFPTFYPNGDYYFFIAKDFSWGYLTHPWLKKAWVFGDCLMKEMKNNMLKLGFTLCTAL